MHIGAVVSYMSLFRADFLGDRQAMVLEGREVSYSPTGPGGGLDWKDNGTRAELLRTQVSWAMWGSQVVSVLGQWSHLCCWLGQTSWVTGEMWYQSTMGFRNFRVYLSLLSSV